jgi:hypothetical protein
MKFALTYDGELKANGKPSHKWEIRKHLHPQLAELWRVSPALRDALNNRWVARKGSFGKPVIHHSVDQDTKKGPPNTDGDWLNVWAPISIKGKSFSPLVRESLALHCGLKILYLRKEEPG